MDCWRMRSMKREERYRQWLTGVENFVNPNQYLQQQLNMASNFVYGLQHRASEVYFKEASLSASPTPSSSLYTAEASPEENESSYGWGSAPHTPLGSQISLPSLKGAVSICSLCRQNEGPGSSFYIGHQLKDKFGNVVCPVLQRHVCEYCGATGTKAHTISYCPKLKKKGKHVRSAVSLKSTLHNSSGRIRNWKI